MANWFTTETTQGIRTLQQRTSGLEVLKKNINTLQSKQNISVLDIGCAEGLIADWITDGKSDRLVGIEGDKVKVDSAQVIYQDKIYNNRYKIVQGDANDVDGAFSENGIKGKFDVVLLLAILQKLADPFRCLEAAVAKAELFVAIRVPGYWLKENGIRLSKVMEGWELMYHIAAQEPDVDYVGHLIVYQKPGLTPRLEDLRKELREISKSSKLADCDYAIVSFPKSGRTWIRYFLGSYISINHGMPFDLEFTPQPYWTQERLRLGFPNIHFTHDWFDIKHSDDSKPQIYYKDILDQKPIIFLLRNPLDTIVSYYYHKVKREKDNQLNLTLREFIQDPRYGLGRYCDWMDQMLDYLRVKRDKIIITYEDMIDNMAREMIQMMRFIHVQTNEDSLIKASEQSEFSKMQAAEINASSTPGQIGIGRLSMQDWDGDSNKLKVRKGKIGSWQEEPELDDNFIQQLIASDDRIKVLFRRMLKDYPRSMLGLEKFVR